MPYVFPTFVNVSLIPFGKTPLRLTEPGRREFTVLQEEAGDLPGTFTCHWPLSRGVTALARALQLPALKQGVNRG